MERRSVTGRALPTGFTLVEILIVVVILGILAIIALPHFSNAANTANRNSVAKDLQTIRGQLDLYSQEHGGAHPTLTDFAAQMTGRTNLAGAPGTDFGPYLNTMPSNPFTGGNAISAPGGDGDWWYDMTTGSFTAKAPHDGL